MGEFWDNIESLQECGNRAEIVTGVSAFVHNIIINAADSGDSNVHRCPQEHAIYIHNPDTGEIKKYCQFTRTLRDVIKVGHADENVDFGNFGNGSRQLDL